MSGKTSWLADALVAVVHDTHWDHAQLEAQFAAAEKHYAIKADELLMFVELDVVPTNTRGGEQGPDAIVAVPIYQVPTLKWDPGGRSREKTTPTGNNVHRIPLTPRRH